MELSVIVPCYNEENNIDILVEKILAVLRKSQIKGEIILVNDGSTDSTQDKIDAVQRRFKNVIGRRHEVNRGIPAAWKTGLDTSVGDYIVITDADLQYAPEDIVKLHSKLMSNPETDLVQGWRRGSEAYDFFRIFASIGLSKLLQKCFAVNLHDPKSGFLITKRDIFAEILEHDMNYFYFQTFIVIAACSKGYRVEEVPVIFYNRHAGKSFITLPLLSIGKVLLDIPKALLEYKIFRAAKGRG